MLNEDYPLPSPVRFAPLPLDRLSVAELHGYIAT